MTPFLKQVAHHYHPAPEISRMCFIFPNKRAVSFFRKYMGEECAAAKKAMISPECLTINDFFARIGGLRPADRMESLVTLYGCYSKLYPNAETLDEFIFWGGVLQSDFAEVDKYLVKADHIFKNVAEFRQMQDDLSYLEPEQREAMESFLGQFKGSGDYKEKFRRIWDILLPLYHSFNDALAAKGLASEGMLYRSIADRLESESAVDVLAGSFPDSEKFVFVGLNALNECEKKVLRKMRDAHLAEFCWDFSSKEIKDPANRSSFFLAQNVAEFPQAFGLDPDGLPRPVVNVVSVPSSVGQTKLLPYILSVPDQDTPSLTAAQPAFAGCSAPPIAGDGPLPLSRGWRRSWEGVPDPAPIDINTAIVLPDEGLLLNVLNSIPPQIENVNVTMGYPMGDSEFTALMDELAAMQLNARERNGSVQFYHRHIWNIFSNSILRSVLDEAGSAIVKKVREEARYYVPQEAFRGSAILELIFRPATDPGQYVREFLLGLAPMLKQHGGMQMELDFAMFAYKAATRLQSLNLQIQPRTWWRLFGQLAGRASVPFDGEPLLGMQIMGPLETRALDFENLIILSCNEGIFPRRAVSPSFIPAELRKGFGLPTYEYQDAVWAYYFYRLIQRAQNVWLIFDSRTELSRSGEESRYIRQMQMLYDFDIRRYVVKAPIREAQAEGAIPKTDGDIAKMQEDGFHLSASALQNYLACPAKFYFSKVKELKAADEVSEALDAGMLGDVLHKTMQTLYSDRKEISRSYLEELLAGKERIRSIIEALIMEQLHTDEVEGRNLIFEDLILKYAEQILRTDLALLQEKGLASFRILGLELKRYKDIGGFHFKGFIDRLDSFERGTVRVVDYKTGKVSDQDILIDDGNAQQVVDALFGPDNSKRPKIALQLYLYDEFLDRDLRAEGSALENCIYQTTDLFVQKPRSVPASPEFRRLMKERVALLLDELRDKDVPWNRTSDTKTCEYCDFKTICGR